MSKRISKRVREEAALLCAVAASTPNTGLAGAEFNLHIDPESGAFDLALSAKDVTSRGLPYRERCAEAEAMLRCGWSPGDEP